MKPVRFHGDSLDAIRSFPDDARRVAGFQIERLQRGLDPNDWKPMNSIGPGVREVRLRAASGAFRVIYLMNLPDAIHILHAFAKKTQTTAKRDLVLASTRLQQILRNARS